MKTLSPLTKLILSWLCFLLLLSCSGNDALRVNLGMSGSVSVFGLDRLEAKPGEEVVVKGQNLSAKVLIEVDSKSTELRVLDSSSASFVVPTDAAKGLLTVTFIKGGRTLAKLPLMNSEAIEGLSAASVPLDSICDTYIVKDENGNLARGTARCDSSLPLIDCTSDGQSGCIATEAFPVAEKSGLAAKVLTGQTVAGVSGSAALRPLDCLADGEGNCVVDGMSTKAAILSGFTSADVRAGVSIAGITGVLSSTVPACGTDGETGCLANNNYPAAIALGAAAKILTGQTLAGVSGSAALRPTDCASDGATNCVVDGTSYKAAKLSNFAAADVKAGVTVAGIAGSATLESHSNCSGDGSTGCVVLGPTYAAALLSNFAGADVKTGVTIAGIAGSATLESHVDCTGNDQSGCVTTSTYKSGDLTNLSAGNVKLGVAIAGTTGTYGPGCSVDGGMNCLVDGTTYKAAKLSNFTSADVKTGVTIAGLAGSATFESHSSCTGNAQTGCITTSTYQSGDLTNLSVGNIKSGVAIAGVTGQYPSSTYPLSGADATADLDSATFNAKIKSSTAFEWFDSAGTRYTGAGDADIDAVKIKGGVDIFGTTGTFGSNCSSDGQTGCLTTSTYKSADTSAYTAWDIRSGKTVGGISGNLAFYKNVAHLPLYNRTTGSAGTFDTSTTVADVYDTVDDSTNPLGHVPPGWPTPGLNWLRDPTSDTDANGACNASEACVYKDLTTNIYWAKDDGTTRTWEAAITYCHNLNYGGYSGWRLPTIKELLQAYIDGIWKQHETALNLWNGGPTWSATSTTSNSYVNAWGIYLSGGIPATAGKSGASERVLCVR